MCWPWYDKGQGWRVVWGKGRGDGNVEHMVYGIEEKSRQARTSQARVLANRIESETEMEAVHEPMVQCYDIRLVYVHVCVYSSLFLSV